MKKKKPSWDDIPSLDLSMEDDESTENVDLRKAVRLVSRDILRMLTDGAEFIYVQVATHERVIKRKGILQDINETGMCFSLPDHKIEKGESIRIGAMLGRRPFKTRAIVRWATKDEIGVEYVKPDPEDVKFLAELYPAKILNRV